MYCFPEGIFLTSTPSGKSVGTSSGLTEGRTIQRSPCCNRVKGKFGQYSMFIDCAGYTQNHTYTPILPVNIEHNGN